MARLVIISNRVTIPDGRKVEAGGLAVALQEAIEKNGGLWFGWSGKIAKTPRDTPKVQTFGAVSYATIDLTPEEHQDFYLGYTNSTLWPLSHYRIGLVDFQRKYERAYLQVNDRFADQIARLLKPDDIVWVHDYHFFPLAAALRRRGVKNRIGFFLHIPFPSTEVLRILPNHRRMIEDLMEYDLIGLQTDRDLRSILDYVVNEAGGDIGPDDAVILGQRRTRIGVYSIGIDTDGFTEMAARAAESDEVQRVKQSLIGRDLMIGTDRLDYSKGLLQRMEAFSELLESHPEHRGKLTMMQIAPVSRGEVEQYRSLRRDLDRITGKINGRYAELDWVPVRYLTTAWPRETLAGLFRIARIGCVTPIRDGMNLVAKEYVASQDAADPGVLVLSEFAGAARELSSAVLVNPFDIDGIANAMHRAQTMPLEERQERWQDMMMILRTNTIEAWREEFLNDLTRLGGSEDDDPSSNNDFKLSTITRPQDDIGRLGYRQSPYGRIEHIFP